MAEESTDDAIVAEKEWAKARLWGGRITMNRHNGGSGVPLVSPPQTPPERRLLKPASDYALLSRHRRNISNTQEQQQAQVFQPLPRSSLTKKQSFTAQSPSRSLQQKSKSFHVSSAYNAAPSSPVQRVRKTLQRSSNSVGVPGKRQVPRSSHRHRIQTASDPFMALRTVPAVPNSLSSDGAVLEPTIGNKSGHSSCTSPVKPKPKDVSVNTAVQPDHEPSSGDSFRQRSNSGPSVTPLAVGSSRAVASAGHHTGGAKLEKRRKSSLAHVNYSAVGDAVPRHSPVHGQVHVMAPPLIEEPSCTIQNLMEGAQVPGSSVRRHITSFEEEHKSKSPDVHLNKKQLNDTSNETLKLRSQSPSFAFLKHRASSANFGQYSTPLRWRIGNTIGAGSFGSVYKCQSKDTGRLFAAKAVGLMGGQAEEAMLKKLQQEVSTMRKLHHPNVVRYLGTEVMCVPVNQKHDHEAKTTESDNLHAANKSDDKNGKRGSESSTSSLITEKRLYIFMEYVSGGSIASMLKEFGPLSHVLARELLLDVLEGLKFLHSRRIIHNDIKGANILITDQGRAKLADFGCSKQIHGMHTQTMAQTVAEISGTLPWMAPEVVKQKGHGRSADMWSVGITVIEMLTGSHPYQGDFSNALSAILHIGTLKQPPPFPPGISDEMFQVLSHCLAINPTDRLSAEELHHKLLTYGSEEAVLDFWNVKTTLRRRATTL